MMVLGLRNYFPFYIFLTARIPPTQPLTPLQLHTLYGIIKGMIFSRRNHYSESPLRSGGLLFCLLFWMFSLLAVTVAIGFLVFFSTSLTFTFLRRLFLKPPHTSPTYILILSPGHLRDFLWEAVSTPPSGACFQLRRARERGNQAFMAQDFAAAVRHFTRGLGPSPGLILTCW